MFAISVDADMLVAWCPRMVFGRFTRNSNFFACGLLNTVPGGRTRPPHRNTARMGPRNDSAAARTLAFPPARTEA